MRPMPTYQILLAALALGASAALAAPAAAAGPSFSIAPIRLEIEATPGKPQTDALQIENESRESARIRVYAEDWRLEKDGAVNFMKAGTGPRSAATWIRINPAEFDLPALGAVDVRFTVNVPRGAPAGGYRAALVVEQVPRLGTGANKQVALRARIASVLYIKVGDALPDAAVQDLRYRREQNGVRSLVLEVENVGAVHFRSAGRILLHDLATGKTLHRIDIPDVPVLPESAREIRIDVPSSVKPGTYLARTEFDLRRKEIFVHEGPVTVD